MRTPPLLVAFDALERPRRQLSEHQASGASNHIQRDGRSNSESRGVLRTC